MRQGEDDAKKKKKGWSYLSDDALPKKREEDEWMAVVKEIKRK